MSYENPRIAHKPRALALILCLSAAATVYGQQVPSTVKEKSFTGTIDAGNRWRWLNGNEDLYRSTINLGEGPKLSAFTTSYRATGKEHPKLADRFEIRTMGWGGEPYSSTHISAGLSDRYSFKFNYKHFDYFNSVPSFANPTEARAGATQSMLDVSRRMMDGVFTLRPNARVSPFLAYDYESGKGPGRTGFVQDGNEYAVDTNIDNSSNTYRGGVNLRFDRWSGGVEAGGSWFHDDQKIDVSGPNLGNRAALFLGTRLFVDGVRQQYRVSGHDRFTRSFVEVHAWNRLSLNGQFSYSRPTTEASYSDSASGKFVLQETLQTFTGERTLSDSTARYPHPSGRVGAEFKPTDRIRIVESISYDRYQIAGSATSTQSFTNPTGSVTENGGSSLKASYIRQRLDAMVDVNDRISLHAGHGYLSASATDPGSVLAESETVDLTRNQADVGVALRLQKRLKLSVDYRDDRGDATFFRTDLRTFKRVQIRGRYQVSSGLEFGVGTSIWNNDNKAADIKYFEKSRETSADVTLAPKEGKWFTLFAGYTRGTFRSDLPFMVPQNRQIERSLYRDRGHNGNLSLTVKPAKKVEARVGGTFFVSTAPGDDGTQTRPTRFYSPEARLAFRVSEDVSFHGDWNWHQYSNRAFEKESYRAHLLSTGFEYRF